MLTGTSRKTRDLLALRPVFDAHVDSLQRALDLGHDLGRQTPGQLDLVRGAKGGLGAVVLVRVVDGCLRVRDGRGAKERCVSTRLRRRAPGAAR